MNGCNISYEHTGVGYSKAYSLDPTNENAEYLYYLMTVTEDASFYLYDSTGKTERYSSVSRCIFGNALPQYHIRKGTLYDVRRRDKHRRFKEAALYQ